MAGYAVWLQLKNLLLPWTTDRTRQSLPNIGRLQREHHRRAVFWREDPPDATRVLWLLKRKNNHNNSYNKS
jgi:hypothetical protein